MTDDHPFMLQRRRMDAIWDLVAVLMAVAFLAYYLLSE